MSDILEKVAAAQAGIEAANMFLRELVQTARDEGKTWADIGRTLGTTRQAAQERFGSTKDASREQHE